MLLTDRITQAQAAAIEHENQITERVLAENAATEARIDTAGRLILRQLDLQMEECYLACKEDTKPSARLSQEPDGEYRLVLLIDETFDEFEERCAEEENHKARGVSITARIDGETVSFPTSKNLCNFYPFEGFRPEGKQSFSTFDEALAYATVGYVLPAPLAIRKLERLVKLYRDLREELTADFPNIEIDFTITGNDPDAVAAAPQLGFKAMANLMFERSYWYLADLPGNDGIRIDDSSLREALALTEDSFKMSIEEELDRR